MSSLHPRTESGKRKGGCGKGTALPQEPPTPLPRWAHKPGWPGPESLQEEALLLWGLRMYGCPVTPEQDVQFRGPQPTLWEAPLVWGLLQDPACPLPAGLSASHHGRFPSYVHCIYLHGEGPRALGCWWKHPEQCSWAAGGEGEQPRQQADGGLASS